MHNHCMNNVSEAFLQVSSSATVNTYGYEAQQRSLSQYAFVCLFGGLGQRQKRQTKAY